MSSIEETFVRDVIEFNRDLLGIAQRQVQLLTTEEHTHLNMALQEELKEFNDAVMQGQIVESVDALIDLMYFAVGGLWKHGLTHAQIVKSMQAVHAANMQKRKGKIAKRYTGAADAVKPENWVSPEVRIADILAS